MGFVDGFNLYHAVDRLGHDHLKWLDLWRLVEAFAPAPAFELSGVIYCSAYATWKPDRYARHREYVRALDSVGVTALLGQFKKRRRSCHRCRSAWTAHEEKESDVSLAVEMVARSFADEYDSAFLVTSDSDLAPAIRTVKSYFPTKVVRVLIPPGQSRSSELAEAAGGRGSVRYIKRAHLEQSLLPAVGVTGSGRPWTRPTAYDPPPHPTRPE